MCAPLEKEVASRISAYRSESHIVECRASEMIMYLSLNFHFTVTEWVHISHPAYDYSLTINLHFVWTWRSQRRTQDLS